MSGFVIWISVPLSATAFISVLTEALATKNFLMRVCVNEGSVVCLLVTSGDCIDS